MSENSTHQPDSSKLDSNLAADTLKTGGLWPQDTSSYWLTRFIILRLLGFVYLIAFLVAANQIVPLVGEHGLLPARSFMERVEGHFGSRLESFWHLPSLFWFNISDQFLVRAAWFGVCLSAVVVLGYSNAIAMALLWALYMSFIHIGQDWYGYGWEIQLLETGFLAIFLCPLLDGRPFPKRKPPTVVIWLFRWLIFRIMLGAGLIKLRGDPCWRDLTCLYYHYETQPIPNPLSWWLHFRPHWFHKFGVLWNHFIELVVPWFAFVPGKGSAAFTPLQLSNEAGRKDHGEAAELRAVKRRERRASSQWQGACTVRHIAGLLLVSFQVVLILSGNLSFLNWLTIVPALACFDDSLLGKVLPRRLVAAAKRAAESAQPSRAHEIAALVLAGLVALLSIPVVTNMLSPNQVMNTSFNQLSLVNTYGAFGSVGQARNEIIFEGTDDAVITSRTQWKEYEFKAKPGNPYRRPAIIAPYQPRIDWQIWFAAMSTPDQYPWTLHFIWKLLHNDAGTLSLIANNPFPDKPHYIRAQFYRYQFAPPGDPSGAWWKRTLLGSWLPPLSTDDPELRRFLAAYGWLPEQK